VAYCRDPEWKLPPPPSSVWLMGMESANFRPCPLAPVLCPEQIVILCVQLFWIYFPKSTVVDFFQNGFQYII
jgi:hypothetical protein